MTTLTERQRETGMLAEALRGLRRRTGLSGKDFAAQLGWHASRVSRIEHGRQIPTAADLRAWSALCQVSRSESAELTGLLRRVEAEHRDWRRRMRQGQSSVQADYNQLVERSASVRHFEVAWVPGLVQTAAYARRVFREQVVLHGLDVHDEEAAVQTRLARGRQLYNPAKRFEFLLAEPVLRWRTCPPEVLREQLAAMREIIVLPNIRFGVLPLDRPIATTPQNGFQIYDSVTVVETFSGEIFFSDGATALYARTLDRLWDDALVGSELDALLSASIASLE
ncbi:MAG: helix-turn-helix transcriptional regulator [Hamadaea sp.]|uniref:helix-turn-helix domain-containing protein n=1 Tax=Hamadaea sp. TaxID=2024425 RepID=UPI0017F2DD96|nr:helix-turn-helix transcriptional regulator [Hamadaea sp.]NUR69438.1 helix-turn-helix transcriptional regulator [Hamadaea sp.]NUT23399.1 helix-turn-helix transcriptional regulator [Hamadaea sp.]